MPLSAQLAASPGRFVGTGDGIESGPFVSRLDVSRLPNDGALIEYEAMSREQGVQHHEISMLVAGPDGRDQLHISHSESPFVTVLVETEEGSGRFEQPEPFGPYALAVVIEIPEPNRITYAWWWAQAGEEPTEQSKADAALVATAPG